MSIERGFLTRTIADVRLNVDEPELNAKYSDTKLVQMLGQSYVHIIGEINRNRKEPIVAKYTVTIVADTYNYLLPAHMGSIYAIYRMPNSVVSDARVFYYSRGINNSAGRGISVVGNELHIEKQANNFIFTVGDEITLEYIPDGTANLIQGACTVDATEKIITLGTTDTGELDTALNAYAGNRFRILTATGSPYIQERQIVSSDRTTPSVTLSLALSPAMNGDSVIKYEICPAISRGLDHVIGLYLAYWIQTIEGDLKRAASIQRMYINAIRTARLEAYYSNMQEAANVRADGPRAMRRRYRRR